MSRTRSEPLTATYGRVTLRLEYAGRFYERNRRCYRDDYRVSAIGHQVIFPGVKSIRRLGHRHLGLTCKRNPALETTPYLLPLHLEQGTCVEARAAFLGALATRTRVVAGGTD